MSCEIIQLKNNEWPRLKAIRLESLKEAPYAFGSTYEDALHLADEAWRSQLLTIPAFLAVDANKDIGILRYVTSRDDERIAILISMWVNPRHRRKAIGQRLIEKVLTHLRFAGYQSVNLDVATGNDAALKLYLKLGFELTDEVSSMGDQQRSLCQYRLRKTL